MEEEDKKEIEDLKRQIKELRSAVTALISERQAVVHDVESVHDFLPKGPDRGSFEVLNELAQAGQHHPRLGGEAAS